MNWQLLEEIFLAAAITAAVFLSILIAGGWLK